MKAIILLLACFCILTLCAQTPISTADTTEYLNVSHRLDVLCTSLYGPKHPLTEYITNYRKLIIEYGTLARRAEQNDATAITQAQKLRVTLNTIRDYALKVLDKYTVTTPQGPTAMTTAQLPETALPPHQASELPVTPAPDTTPAQQNQAMQQYMHAMQTTPATANSNHDDPRSELKDQASFLGVGIGIIAILLFIGRKLLGANIDAVMSMHREQFRFVDNIQLRTHDLNQANEGRLS